MTQADNRAQEVKEAISELLRKIAPDRESKEALADYIDISFSSVEGMIYRQQGGADAWINAILYIFDLDSAKVQESIGNLQAIVTKKNPLKESDKIWFKDMDYLFTEEEKLYWLAMMKYAAKLKRSKRK